MQRPPVRTDAEDRLGCSTWCWAGPGRSTPTGCVPAAPFTTKTRTATPDPFRGYGNVIREALDDAVAVLDAVHVAKLGLQAMEEVRRRVQRELLGHRGRKHDSLYEIRNALRAGTDNFTARQIGAKLQAGDPDFEVTTLAWRCYQRLRSAFAATSLVEGRRIAESVVDSYFSRPIPEITGLGRKLAAWRP